MKQSRARAVANARRTASNRVNAKRASMRGATGSPVSFQRDAGEFRSAAHGNPEKKASIAVSKLIPFL
tara:strand:+ start:457 stop:660 length:204 start_codon:yes stop_codon:yes gene_type:complete